MEKRGEREREKEGLLRVRKVRVRLAIWGAHVHACARKSADVFPSGEKERVGEREQRRRREWGERSGKSPTRIVLLLL